MDWDKESFYKLVKQIESSLKGKLSPLGVPFYVYVYDPRHEVECLRQFKNLANQLKNQGFFIQIVYLGQVLSYALKELPYLKSEGKEIEKRYRSNLRRELANILPEKIAYYLLNGIPGKTKPIKGDKLNQGNFLLRAGALFPFVHISQILAYLENQTQSTIVIPFPGTRQREKLSFLNETEGHYYRAMIFGG